MSYLPGKFVWFEHVSNDTTKAKAFYSALCGWTVSPMPMGGQPYDIIMDMGPQGTYYILKDKTGKMRGGAMQQPPGMAVPSHWLPYIHVADCDASAAKATQLGAQAIMMPPTDIPDIGRFAVIIDPQGAAIAVIKGV